MAWRGAEGRGGDNRTNRLDRTRNDYIDRFVTMYTRIIPITQVPSVVVTV